jgi:trk system potassium uptake protein
MLPVSSAKGESQSFIDALFMASSGISTTGLTVADVGSYYSLFGQIVLMLDFQIGGIGYMAFFVLIAHAFRKKLLVTSR